MDKGWVFYIGYRRLHIEHQCSIVIAYVFMIMGWSRPVFLEVYLLTAHFLKKNE